MSAQEVEAPYDPITPPVPNKVLRERLEYLMSDPGFSVCAAARRVADQGFPRFLGGKAWGDSTPLFRVLGIKSTPGKRRKNGNGRYPSTIRTHIPYDQAAAICRALDMDLSDAGL